MDLDLNGNDQFYTSGTETHDIIYGTEGANLSMVRVVMILFFLVMVTMLWLVVMAMMLFLGVGV